MPIVIAVLSGVASFFAGTWAKSVTDKPIINIEQGTIAEAEKKTDNKTKMFHMLGGAVVLWAVFSMFRGRAQ